MLLVSAVTWCYCAGVGCGASGTACKSSQTGEVQRSQQRVTAANCCGGAPCGQLADLWNTQTFGGGDIRTLGIDRHTLGAYADILPMDEQGSELEAASVSGSEQISGYDPVGHRNRSSMSSDWANSRTSLGSTRDWQVWNSRSTPQTLARAFPLVRHWCSQASEDGIAFTLIGQLPIQMCLSLDLPWYACVVVWSDALCSCMLHTGFAKLMLAPASPTGLSGCRMRLADVSALFFVLLPLSCPRCSRPAPVDARELWLRHAGGWRW